MSDGRVGQTAQRHSSRWAVMGLLAAGAVTAAMALHPTGSPPSAGPVSGAPLVGEHSALGDRLVDEINAATSAMEQPRGEHAGMSRDENEGADALDGGGR
jgi:hypothetical protein